MRTNPTPAEKALWVRLRNCQVLGCKFRRQHSLERFIVDFYSSEAMLVIEVDGDIHLQTQEADAIRQEVLESMGLHVLRFTNDQVLTEIEEVVEQIGMIVELRIKQQEP